MGSNVDKYVTPTEHSAIDHTGLPGVGVGGTINIVGAEVLFADDAPAGGTIFTVPTNKLTVDGQSLDISINFTPGTGADPGWVVQLGGLDLLNWTTIPVGAATIGFARIRVFRTGAATGRATVHAWVGQDNLPQAGFTEVYNNDTGTIALDWTTALALTSVFTGGTAEALSNFHILRWPEAGSLGVSGIGSDTLPVGVMVPFAGTVASVPAGFLPCDGSLADQSIEIELFAAIGTTWNTGGEPGGFFRLPDARGKSLLGLNDGTLPNGADGGFTTRLLAAVGGEEAHSLSAPEGAPHGHSITDPGHIHGVTDPGHQHVTDNSAAGTGESLTAGGGAGNLNASATTGVTVDSASSGITVNTTGSGTAPNTMHPFAVCPYIIKSQQVGGGIGVSGQNNGGVLLGPQPALNFIPAGIVGLTVFEDVGNNRLNITISASETFTAAIHSTTNHAGIWPYDRDRRQSAGCYGVDWGLCWTV
jgi:microcystin-dependent protein